MVRSLTGAVLYGVCTGDGGGSIEGTGEAVGAAMFGLVVISGAVVTGNQTGTGEVPRWTGNCSSREKRGSEWRSTRGKEQSGAIKITRNYSQKWYPLVDLDIG